MELTTTGALLLELAVLIGAMVLMRVGETLWLHRKRGRSSHGEPSIQALQEHNARQQQQIDRLEDAAEYQLKELIGIDSDVRQLVVLMGGKPRPKISAQRPALATGQHRRSHRRHLFPGDT